MYTFWVLCASLGLSLLVGKAQLVWTLQVCSETLIGNDMMRGVSGGQRKRVTTGKQAFRFAANTSSCLKALAKL